MRFPTEFLERLRNHLPLSEVVGKRVPIKRHGREFHALCPFHKEKSPSFTVNDEKGFYHCFGCSAHGDAIGFIREFEGVSYLEAIERLAIEAGLPLPKMTQEAEAVERKRHTLEDVMALAGQWFRQQLATPAGKEAREYIHNRGLSDETVERFGIGFAPNGRAALKTAFMQQGISEALLIESGLLAVTDTNESYDRFRGRLMFPIRSAQGKVVAFGGRILPSSQTDRTAKYLNSPETPLFKKGELLFAYDIAARAARGGESLIVAEGYMDVIALHQAGFTSAVAPLGTAITEPQLKLMWRVSPEPVLCLDADDAGARAMLRAAELAVPLLKPGFSLRFARLSVGEDPDSMIRKSGAAALREVLAQARVLSQVMWEHALEQYGCETAEKKASLEHYLRQLSDRALDPLMRQHLNSYFRDRLYSLNKQKKGNFIKPVTANLHVLPPVDDDATHLKRLEDQLVSIILLHPDLLHQSEVEEHFGHMDFLQPALDRLRVSALEISALTPSTDSAALCAALNSLGHEEKVETLLHSKNATLPANARAKIEQHLRAAATAWEQTYGAYTMKKQEHEMQDALRLLERDPSQANLDRLYALQKQIDVMRQNHYRSTSDEQAF